MLLGNRDLRKRTNISYNHDNSSDESGTDGSIYSPSIVSGEEVDGDDSVADEEETESQDKTCHSRQKKTDLNSVKNSRHDCRRI